MCFWYILLFILLIKHIFVIIMLNNTSFSASKDTKYSDLQLRNIRKRLLFYAVLEYERYLSSICPTQ